MKTWTEDTETIYDSQMLHYENVSLFLSPDPLCPLLPAVTACLQLGWDVLNMIKRSIAQCKWWPIKCDDRRGDILPLEWIISDDVWGIHGHLNLFNVSTAIDTWPALVRRESSMHVIIREPVPNTVV
jgi:hypothetical protein